MSTKRDRHRSRRAPRDELERITRSVMSSNEAAGIARALGLRAGEELGIEPCDTI
jgi:hypothetical protein